MDTLRVPSVFESDLLELLLNQEFPGAPELRAQLPDLEVASIDADGSLSLYPRPDSPVARVDKRVPAEGAYLDNDGMRVHVLVHVVDGRLQELELYREDGKTVNRQLISLPNDLVLDLW
jgi:hypothetical protein